MIFLVDRVFTPFFALLSATSLQVFFSEKRQVNDALLFLRITHFKLYIFESSMPYSYCTQFLAETQSQRSRSLSVSFFVTRWPRFAFVVLQPPPYLFAFFPASRAVNLVFHIALSPPSFRASWLCCICFLFLFFPSFYFWHNTYHCTPPASFLAKGRMADACIRIGCVFFALWGGVG